MRKFKFYVIFLFIASSFMGYPLLGQEISQDIVIENDKSELLKKIAFEPNPNLQFIQTVVTQMLVENQASLSVILAISQTAPPNVQTAINEAIAATGAINQTQRAFGGGSTVEIFGGGSNSPI